MQIGDHTSPGVTRTPSVETSDRDTLVVVVRLDAREYALPLDRVLEIALMVDITPVPEAAEWLKGVIDYRGSVVPVVDLRRRLGLKTRDVDASTPLVIVSSAPRVLALIVDEVEGLVEMSSRDITRAEDRDPHAAVGAIARHDERVLLVLDLDRLGIGTIAVGSPADENLRSQGDAS